MPEVFDVRKHYILSPNSSKLSAGLASCSLSHEMLSCSEEGRIDLIHTNTENEGARISISLAQLGYQRFFENCWVFSSIEVTTKSRLLNIFFGLISDDYESMIDPSKNIACYEHLNRLTGENDAFATKKTFDFGCGTGIICDTSFYSKMDVLGYDANELMAARAYSKGLAVLSPLDFENLSGQTFDIIYSCFVFHYGLARSVFLKLLSLLLPGGCLVANVHKDLNLSAYKSWTTQLALQSAFRTTFLQSEFGTVLLVRLQSE